MKRPLSATSDGIGHGASFTLELPVQAPGDRGEGLSPDN